MDNLPAIAFRLVWFTRARTPIDRRKDLLRSGDVQNGEVRVLPKLLIVGQVSPHRILQ